MNLDRIGKKKKKLKATLADDKPGMIQITDNSPNDLASYMYPFPYKEAGVPFRAPLENLLTFNDLSDEQYRVYDFGTHQIRLKNPMKLNVSENGHRVYTADGISHYIPKGWIHLYWQVKPLAPHFAF